MTTWDDHVVRRLFAAFRHLGPKSRPALAVALIATLSVPLPSPLRAAGLEIHTGGAKGAYHATFCPPLAAAIGAPAAPPGDAAMPAAPGDDPPASASAVSCVVSAGTEENMRRIYEAPGDLAFGQLDVLTLEQPAYGGARAFREIRRDIARECVYAVARNPALRTFGDIAGRASRLRFVLPPPGSGSAGTFRHLQSIDADLAAAGEVRHAASPEEAIRLALASDNAVAIFVQFPDPSNPRFRLVGELGGHFIPVIDRAILERRVDGRDLYEAQETEVADASWLEGSQSLVTACTPMVLFTGAADRLQGDAVQRQGALVTAVQAVPAEHLAPKDSLLAAVLKRTRRLSATTVEGLVSVSEAARAKTKPLLDKAREATAKALEAAKPHVESAKESGAATIEKAKETVKDLIEPASPEPPRN